MLYRGKGNILRHIALRDGSNTFGSYIIKTIGKKTKEIQKPYKLLSASANTVGYGVRTFLDESGTAINNLSFDVFMYMRLRQKQHDSGNHHLSL